MEIISIKKLRYLYESYKSKQPKYKLQNFLKFNYLNLSIHFGRDEREFDESNFRILLNLTKNKGMEEEVVFQNKQYIDFLVGICLLLKNIIIYLIKKSLLL